MVEQAPATARLATPSVASHETAARTAMAALALRENVLKLELGQHNLVGPGLAVGVAIPVAVVTLTIGGLLFRMRVAMQMREPRRLQRMWLQSTNSCTCVGGVKG